jgi:hypothetical protein
MVRGEGRGYTEPSYPLQSLLGASQTTLCASLSRAAGPVLCWLMISTDNTYDVVKLKERK